MTGRKLKRSNLKAVIAVFLGAALIFVSLAFVISNMSIKITSYDYDADGNATAKIALLTDLHGKEFGEGNWKLLDALEDSAPDIICLAGDFIDADNDDEDNQRFLELVAKMMKIAPVYYSYGNHDLLYANQKGNEIFRELEKTGCIILDENYIHISAGDGTIRLGGLYDYAFGSARKESTIRVSEFLTDFTDTDLPTLLLCHRPDSFIFGSAYKMWDVDLVLCGHTHGGLWRLPFIGGLVAPEQGFNPEYDYGEFILEDITMIISSGFSGYKAIPRLFNRPEITIINIT